MLLRYPDREKGAPLPPPIAVIDSDWTNTQAVHTESKRDSPRFDSLFFLYAMQTKRWYMHQTISINCSANNSFFCFRARTFTTSTSALLYQVCMPSCCIRAYHTFRMSLQAVTGRMYVIFNVARVLWLCRHVGHVGDSTRMASD